MNITLQTNPARRSKLAMTLIEMMTAMAIFLVAMSGMFALHIFGLRYDQVVGSKLGASDQTRQAFNKLLNDIRASKWIRVGTNTTGNSFVAVPSGQNLIGPALQIGYATNFNYGLSNVINYYFTTDGKLRRSTNGYSGYDTLCSYITNNPVFRGEDYKGNALTALDNHSVIGIKMEFYQYQYPLTKVGSNYLYDYYKLEFKASSRDYN